MDTGGIGTGIMQIAMGILGIALIALLVGNAGGASQLVGTAGDTFNQLLRTVTLQDSGMGSSAGVRGRTGYGY